MQIIIIKISNDKYRFYFINNQNKQLLLIIDSQKNHKILFNKPYFDY
jgi:hypothetical protein